MKKVCENVPVVALKRDDSACEELRKEFDIPWRNSHVVVLDGKGEILASYLGDTAGKGCTKASAEKFPGMFAAKIDECLKRTASVQELERNFEKDPADETNFKSLQSRAEEMNRFGKLIELCEKILKNNNIDNDVRNALRIKSLLFKPRDRKNFMKAEIVDEFVSQCEKLIIELSTHKEIKNLVSALFNSGYGERFDVPTRSKEGIARLEKMAETSPDSKSVNDLIKELSDIRAKWIDTTTKTYKSAKNEYSKARFAGLLGESDTFIELMSNSRLKGNYIFQAWLKDAKEKKEKTQKGSK